MEDDLLLHLMNRYMADNFLNQRTFAFKIKKSQPFINQLFNKKIKMSKEMKSFITYFLMREGYIKDPYEGVNLSNLINKND